MPKAEPESTTPARSTARQGWKQDPASVKADILKVATGEIATYGLSGSRINVIAEKCKTSKRMIYYYFGDKEGLYRAVLECAYESVRSGEQDLKLDHLMPIPALETLVEFTFRHHSQHPDFIRLIMIENVHNGKYLAQSETIKEVNAPAINRVKKIYERGLQEGYFREGFTALELHWYISALSFFNVSNRASFSMVFGDSLGSAEGQERLVAHTKEMILRFVLKPDHACRYIGADRSENGEPGRPALNPA
ncbi:MAG: TetR family transcriptional regulator [Gammaproteobacteria bacterium]|nr:TetR family transcriptional regulator [Gammaproteobacteria bacterium]